jgi:hypothetical protein
LTSENPQFAELPVVVVLVLHHCSLTHYYNSNVKFRGPLGYPLP